MTGTGYCLEATDGPLFTDFAAQCGGSLGQRWQFTGATGALTPGRPPRRPTTRTLLM
jgi:hypothetical protein